MKKQLEIYRIMLIIFIVLIVNAGLCFAGVTYTILGENGTGDGQFDNPKGVALDSNGNIYVADKCNYRIQKLDSDGNFLNTFGSYGTGDGQFDYPHGVALDNDGNIYIADTDNDRIQKLDSDGNYQDTWGNYLDTYGVVVDSDGNIYIADSGNHCIQKLKSDGTHLDTFGSYGIGDGQFNVTRGVALDSAGNIYVADKKNHRIQKLDSDGNFLSAFGSYGTGNGQFNNPCGVAVDSAGNIYVADTGNGRIQKLDSNGNHLGTWGSLGTGEGQFKSPCGVAVDSAGNIYVADSSNNRIQKLEFELGITSTTPIDNTENISIASDLTIQFDEAVQKGSGNISIKKTSDDSLVEVIDVTSINITGWGTTILTINPQSDLDYNTGYYVVVDGGAILSTYAFAGITDKTEWNFDTESAETTITKDLKVYWSFDNGLSPKIGDNIFNLSNSAGATLGQHMGRNSVKFERDKSQSLSTIPGTNIIDLNTDFTYMAWYYIDESVTEDERHFVLESTGGELYTLSYGIRKDSNDTLLKGQVFSEPGNNTYIGNASNQYGAGKGKWYNIIVTYNDSIPAHTVYINGVYAGTLNAKVKYAVPGLIIGSYRNVDNRFWDGYIDEVAIWNRVLTVEEIQSLQTAQITGQNTYTVTYDGNGNTSGAVLDRSIYEEGTIITILGTVDNTEETQNLVKNGYYLDGWNTKANGSGTQYAIGAQITRGAVDITLYAQWNVESYDITYDLNGGTNYDGALGNYTIESAEITLGTPIKNGFTFEGWYGSNAYTNQVTTIPMGSTGNKTLYAKWIPNPVTVDTAYKVEHYKENIGGSGYTLAETENKTGTNETTATATSKIYKGFTEDTGYVDRVASGTIVADGSLVLKLYYNRDTYTVDYITNGGSAVDSVTGVKYEATITEPATPTKEGYIFAGWYKDESYTNIWDFTMDKVNSNTKLYAKWTKTGSSHSSNSSSNKLQKDNIVNAETDNGRFKVGKINTEYNSESKKETIIEVDKESIEYIISKIKSNNTISIDAGDDVAIVKAQLSVKSIKDMQDKDLTLEVKNEQAIYDLSTSKIDIEDISNEVGEAVELKDIKFSVEISKTSNDMVKVVKSATKNNGLAIVVPPVDFKIETSYKNKIYKVDRFKGFVSRKIEIPQGVDVSKITTAIVTEKDGSIRHIPTYVTKINGKYYANINSLTNSTYTLIYNKEIFSDVTDNHWAKKYIEKIAGRMIVEGKEDGTFAPDEDITRAEFAKTIVIALGLKPEELQKFDDIESRSHIAGYIGTAYSYGIINGISENKFNPQGLVTRQDAMTMIYRANKITDFIDKGNSKDMNSYVDYMQVSDYAKEAVAWNVKNHIILDKTDTVLAPFDNITRAELCTVINKYLISVGLIE